MGENEIAEGLGRGSPEAFRAIYAEHGRAVLSYLVRMVGRREMAEELAQETFLMAIRKIGFFRPRQEGGLKAWIFRIATNLAIDALRREKRMDLSEDPGQDIAAESAGAEEQLERFEFSRALENAILCLSATQRTIFLLREQEEMSCMDISRVCGLSENAVKQSLFRARARLRRELCV